jgi:hypothetical protein
MRTSESRLGIDIGRVIISRGEGSNDTSFLHGSIERALQTPPYENMFEVVPRLVARFGGRAWLVSKCGPRIQERTRQWLEHHRFWERTGIPPENVRFCRDRPGKAPICRELGITHFIDDRLDVLEYLRGSVPHLYLFAAAFAPQEQWLTPLTGWPEALQVVWPQAKETGDSQGRTVD